MKEGTEEQMIQLKEENKEFDFVEMALLEDELHELEEKYGVEKKPKLWQRIGDWYFQKKKEREKHQIRKKAYLWLTVLLGWAGIHRFYEKRWVLGLFYLALSWTGLPVAFAVVDFMIALPMKPDEKGCIWI